MLLVKGEEMMCDILIQLAELEDDLRAAANCADTVSWDSRCTLTEANIAVGQAAGLSDAADLVAALRAAHTETPTLIVVGDVPASILDVVPVLTSP